ncbi:hypothetical protein F5882DRAFT_391147 [Hyaloscypha sp. PMI_1271]|nr:hypothetical protein F5882DRAFT_391147 [Hyaloscypha sp. PMI_1271]
MDHSVSDPSPRKSGARQINSQQLPTFPPPAYHVSQAHSHSHSQSNLTLDQRLLHIPAPQTLYLSTPAPEVSESKWARRSLSSQSIYYTPPQSDLPKSESNYTESRRNYKSESRRKFILFAVAILLMLAAMLAIVGVTTHFRLRSHGCTTGVYNGSWVCA